MQRPTTQIRTATALSAVAASVFLQFVVASKSAGSEAPAARMRPSVTAAAYQGESPALSSVRPGGNAVLRRGAHPAKGLPPSAAAPASPTPDANVQTVAGTASALTTGTSFEGVSHDAIGVTEPCGTPPDPNSDVSDSYIVEIVNCGYAVFNKSGATLVGPLTTDQVFTGMAGPCSQTNDGDGVVRYDRLANRWLVSQFSLANYDGLTDPSTNQVYTQNFQCVAISKTSDPTGEYWLYAFAYTGFNDYPKFGVWPDGYYVTYNMFSLDGNSYTGVKTCALDRASMLTGAAATQQCFSPSSTFSILPANFEGSTAPPAGAPNYQVALGSSTTLKAWKFQVNWTTPANSTFTALSSITVNTYAGACATSYSCIPQAPAQFYTTSTLDSLGDRLMYALQYRNFGDHESLVVSHSIKVNNGGANERWYELRVGPSTSISDTLTLFQQGTYAPGDGLYRFMGAVAQDGAGDMALGYSVSSASIHPGIRMTGRLVNDPTGTLTESEHDLKDGTGSESYDPAVTSPAIGRWGDYTSMDIDPADDCTFWYSNEYYNAQTDSTDTHFYRRWHTQISSFTFCDFAVSVSPTSRTVNSTTTATVHTTLLSGPSQNVDFSVSGCPDGATCTISPTSAAVGTDVTLTIQPGTAIDGTYPLSVTGTGSVPGVQHSTPFTLTLDRTKPTAALTAPSSPFVLTTSTDVTWTGSDGTGSGIDHFDIQQRVAGYNAGFGAWSPYATEPADTLSTTATGLSRGHTYCFRVRAVDVTSNIGNWSAARCTAVPLDDRALTATTGWTRVTGSPYWNGTSTNTSTQNKALTRTGAQLDQVGILATRCSTCGVVGVYVGTHLIGKINTAGALLYQKLYLLPVFSYRTGTVKVKVLSSGKPVKIDGLALTRA